MIRGLVGGIGSLALTATLLLVDPFATLSEDERTLAARSEAMTALASLRAHDFDALDERLAARRADPDFAYFFALHATPRLLGDAIGSSADRFGPVADRLDPTVYRRVLSNLAATLSLATHGRDDLTLPSSWTGDFALATTDPDDLYEDAVNEARVEQDHANKQNLLLLLSRGRWSTGFLQDVTAAYWSWEHDPEASDDPWPGEAGKGALYAPAPGGTFIGDVFLRDGMVALLAALTANPEAAGWAFTDFQRGTVAIQVAEDETRDLGEFTHHLFFERAYDADQTTGAENIGYTASVTALMAAMKATGGAHGDGAVGPQADAYVLQDLRAAVEAAEDEEDHDRPWYGQVTHAVSDGIAWLKGRSKDALGFVGLLPVVGAPADVANAIWSGIEGDWESAGLSLVGVVPIVGDGVQVARAGYNTVKAVQTIRTARTLRPGARAVAVVRLAGATKGLYDAAVQLDDGMVQLDDPESYLAVLEQPLPAVTYVYGETAYELASDGTTLVHLGGPDRAVIERLIADRPIGDAAPAPAAVDEAADASQVRERAEKTVEDALSGYAAEAEVDLITDQVLARVAGRASGRYFDGLVLKRDGSYEGIEVWTGDVAPVLSQAAFDDLLDEDNPAFAELGDETVTITSVRIVHVDHGLGR